MTTEMGGKGWLTVPPPRRTIHELIERSSLGEPEAVNARASVTDAQVAEVLRRLAALMDGQPS